MKKILLFIALFFIPFMVKAADVEITSVELVDKSDTVYIEDEPSFNGLKINIDLDFGVVSEFVKYDVEVKNNSKEDYEIDDSTKYNDGKYIKYEITYTGSKIIKAGEKKKFSVIITYDKEIPEDKYVNGKYNEKNNMVINLTADYKNNPNTKTFPIIIACIAVLSIVLLIVTYKSKKSLTVIMLAALLIPLTIFALEKISIGIEANTVIRDDAVFSVFENGEFGIPLEDYRFLNVKYQKGMNWEEFMPSEYYGRVEMVYYLPNIIIGQSAPAEDYYFVSNDYYTCIEDLELPTYDPDMTEEELEHYYSVKDAMRTCFEDNREEVYSNDLIKPNTEGFYTYQGR